jgi:hypothetical protein
MLGLTVYFYILFILMPNLYCYIIYCKFIVFSMYLDFMNSYDQIFIAF